MNGDKGEGQDKAEDDKSSAGDEGNDKGKSGDGEKDETGEKKKEYRKKTCNDCNKQYCLSQGLKICEGKAMEDVWTTCFRMFYPSPFPPCLRLTLCSIEHLFFYFPFLFFLLFHQCILRSTLPLPLRSYIRTIYLKAIANLHA